VVQRAVAGAQGLSDIDRCPTAQAATVGALPEGQREAARATEIEGRLAAAEANILGGRYDRAMAIAEEAHRSAQHLGHPPTLARANKTLGTAYHYAGRNEAAAQRLTEAIRLSSAAGLTEDEARAWSMLLYVEGDRLDRPEAALAKRLAAETALQRAGSPPMTAAYLASDLGIVLSRAGHKDEALAQHQRAVERWRALGKDLDGLAKALNNLGIALAQAKRLEEAKAALQEALEIQRGAHRQRPSHRRLPAFQPGARAARPG
ncbi:MAG: tetratricopeptide repeat protein, partial [Nannocystaceae bacterium]|nr:tetratricopeptide repeat protein [Nannocystaceae bacterium]